MTIRKTTDVADYSKMSIIKEGFEEFHFTEVADYQSDAFSIPHSLGYTPIALVYMLETIGIPVEVTAGNFIGEPLPSISPGFSYPWSVYSNTFFRADKQNLNIYRQSFHTNDVLDYNLYFKYFLFSQTSLN